MVSADNIDGRIRWEYTYCIEPVASNDLVETLSNFGGDGWEIASTDIFYPHNQDRPLMSIIFKRSWKLNDEQIGLLKEILEVQPSKDE